MFFYWYNVFGDIMENKSIDLDSNIQYLKGVGPDERGHCGIYERGRKARPGRGRCRGACPCQRDCEGISIQWGTAVSDGDDAPGNRSYAGRFSGTGQRTV